MNDETIEQWMAVSPTVSAEIREIRRLIDPRTSGAVVGEQWRTIVERAAERAGVDGGQFVPLDGGEPVHRLERELAMERDLLIATIDDCCG